MRESSGRFDEGALSSFGMDSSSQTSSVSSEAMESELNRRCVMNSESGFCMKMSFARNT